jgi:two-component system chemotaxis sensor kinase CheA
LTDKSKYVDMFVEEAREHLQILNQNLLDLEKKGFNKEYINAAYRIVHTIKGSASVLGIESIADLAHAMEDLFDLFREMEEKPEDDLLDLLFKCLDIIENMIQELSEIGTIKTDANDLIGQMNKMLVEIKKSDSIQKNGEKIKKHQQFTLSQEQKNQVMETLSKGKNVYEVSIEFKKNVRFKEGRVFQLLKNLSSIGYVIATSPDTKKIDDEITEIKLLVFSKKGKKTLKEIAGEITGINDISVNQIDSSFIGKIQNQQNEVKNNKEKSSKPQLGLIKSDTIRVKSKLLDQLLDLVGEIMISNIRVNQIASDLKHRELRQVLKNAERLISELQDTVLRMRMVPVDYIFKRFPRMVRDMAKEEGKVVDFKMVGSDIEIDRSLLDEIGDALVHLLRNAVDHGIESEEDRKAKGKMSLGKLKLSAFREQSNIVIMVEDDGRGININDIINKSIQDGIITEEEAEDLDEKKALQLAFVPGMSTASKVTEISGRGVGLDAVKNKIEALGGTVKLESEKGIGTKFTMKLPPSMSIIGAMLVEVNNESYAIPLENVKETTKVPIKEIHEIAQSGVFRLREEILPLLNVHSEFGGKIESFEEDMPVIIVEKDENRAGFIVTRFIGQQEIVVKTLNKDLRHAPYFSGATILGDGNVALILDVGAMI